MGLCFGSILGHKMYILKRYSRGTYAYYNEIIILDLTPRLLFCKSWKEKNSLWCWCCLYRCKFLELCHTNCGTYTVKSISRTCCYRLNNDRHECTLLVHLSSMSHSGFPFYLLLAYFTLSIREKSKQCLISSFSNTRNLLHVQEASWGGGERHHGHWHRDHPGGYLQGSYTQEAAHHPESGSRGEEGDYTEILMGVSIVFKDLKTGTVRLLVSCCVFSSGGGAGRGQCWSWGGGANR